MSIGGLFNVDGEQITIRFEVGGEEATFTVPAY